jgi:hypothetical protein
MFETRDDEGKGREEVNVGGSTMNSVVYIAMRLRTIRVRARVNPPIVAWHT